MGAALGIGIWLAALDLKYRDVKHLIPFFLQGWLLVTLAAYPTSLVPERWRLLCSLNPMTSVVEGFRSILLGTSTALDLMLAVSVAAVSLWMVSGRYYFQRRSAHSPASYKDVLGWYAKRDISRTREAHSVTNG